jgi:hypothetical protein
MRAASADALAPSYMDAFATSTPSSDAAMVWNSKIDCSVPWLTSDWYGVYAVRNSVRAMSWSTAGCTRCL